MMTFRKLEKKICSLSYLYKNLSTGLVEFLRIVSENAFGKTSSQMVYLDKNIHHWLYRKKKFSGSRSSKIGQVANSPCTFWNKGGSLVNTS